MPKLIVLIFKLVKSLQKLVYYRVHNLMSQIINNAAFQQLIALQSKNKSKTCSSLCLLVLGRTAIICLVLSLWYPVRCGHGHDQTNTGWFCLPHETPLHAKFGLLPVTWCSILPLSSLGCPGKNVPHCCLKEALAGLQWEFVCCIICILILCISL